MVSLAVTDSLRGLLGGLSTGGQLPEYNRWLMVLSLILTVIPFYHGANRYLDATYVTGERYAVRLALLLDFVMLFLEGLIFFGIAMLSYNENYFYTALAVVLVFDAIWVVSTKITERISDIELPSHKIYVWAILNIITAFLICVFTWSNILVGEFWSTKLAKSISLVSIVALRTTLDYILMWEFYYPKVETDIQKASTPAVELK